MTPGAWKREMAADFRRQLVLPQQRDLFDHWLSQVTEDRWPDRYRLHPRQLRAWLPNLLLLRLAPFPEGVQVRLAGSELWDIYGGELTGATLQNGFQGPALEHWRRVYEQAHAAPRPMSGHGRGLCARDHLVLFWLRLPLSGPDGSICLLGLDIALPLSRVQGDMAPTEDSEALPGDGSTPGAPVATSATSATSRISSKTGATGPLRIRIGNLPPSR